MNMAETLRRAIRLGGGGRSVLWLWGRGAGLLEA